MICGTYGERFSGCMYVVWLEGFLTIQGLEESNMDIYKRQDGRLTHYTRQ